MDNDGYCEPEEMPEYLDEPGFAGRSDADDSDLPECGSDPGGPVLELTDDQKQAVELVLSWLEEGEAREFVLTGAAGTGKTTVIKQLLNTHIREVQKAVGSYAVCAPTGKAASVLRRKGLTASTVHKLIYTPERDPGSKTVRFHRVEFLGMGLVVVDEASMANDRMRRDLLGLGTRVLWVGDRYQLPPVNAEGSLVDRPDAALEQIHRQAEGSDIIRLATHVRHRGHPKQFLVAPSLPGTLPQVVLASKGGFYDSLVYADQVICGFNKTRFRLNEWFRREKGFNPECPQAGDKIICLQNNAELGVYNGMIATLEVVRGVSNRFLEMDVRTEDGALLEGLTADLRQFNAPKDGYNESQDITYWDYAYAISCHKSQGSEWDKVLVLEETHPDWDANRWRYTAITRAAKQLVYCW